MGEKDYRLVEHEKPWKYKEDDYTVTRGSAWTGPGCHEGCGVLLYTDDDGKLVKVEGDPENPFNQGRLCVRCLDLPEVTNHKDRLLYPCLLYTSPRQLRRAHVREGRGAGEDRGRPGEPLQPGAPLPAVPGVQGDALP